MKFSLGDAKIHRAAFIQSICLDYKLISDLKMCWLSNWIKTRIGILDTVAQALLLVGGAALLKLPVLSVHAGMLSNKDKNLGGESLESS